MRRSWLLCRRGSGIEEANRGYAEAAERAQVILAEAHGDPVGLLVIGRHHRAAAEIHLLAVHPQWHRHGVGRRLRRDAERALVDDGVSVYNLTCRWG